jgi:hypothetical protein
MIGIQLCHRILRESVVGHVAFGHGRRAHDARLAALMLERKIGRIVICTSTSLVAI